VLQLDNQTPFQAAIAVLPDRAGIDTLYVVVKATVTLQPVLSLADAQVPVTMADEYYGDPATSSLRSGSELHLVKPGTDVLLIGSARAPGGRPVPRMQVSMSVAERRKTLLVAGDRVWRDGRPSNPQPFDSMPLVWERAYGGSHRRGDRVLAEERNPVGRGFAGGRSAADLQGQPVPNLEDPAAPLQQRLRRRGCRAARMRAPTTRRGSAAARPTCPTTSIPGSSNRRRRSSSSIAICRAANQSR
jgi:hypothetical protein